MVDNKLGYLEQQSCQCSRQAKSWKKRTHESSLSRRSSRTVTTQKRIKNKETQGQIHTKARMNCFELFFKAGKYTFQICQIGIECLCQRITPKDLYFHLYYFCSFLESFFSVPKTKSENWCNMTPHVSSVGVLFDTGSASAPASATAKLQADALNACALSLLTQSSFCLLLQKAIQISLVKISPPEDFRRMTRGTPMLSVHDLTKGYTICTSASLLLSISFSGTKKKKKTYLKNAKTL